MLWNWYTIDSCFLAESWHVGSNGAFAASCIGTILLVMVLEALRRAGKEYDDWILRGFRARAAQARLACSQPQPRSASSPSSSSSSATGNPPPKGPTAKVTPASAAWKRLGGAAAGAPGGAVGGGGRAVVFRASPLQQVLRAVVHAAALGLAYIVMLLVMSYNGYIIICVIIGGGLGKFFCDWMTRQYIIDGDGSGEEEGAAGIEEPSVCCS
ncbi:putative copper transport protein ctr4 [Diaporthe ampelina]|uniref:Copper transport protein n=1 Tax=Diaporthe ampelina TaxID=1214573 RepID=A0A0G2FJJ8_9PEZI|nr:putative copper transport protein ctr4 [Diaporthe ampelina]